MSTYINHQGIRLPLNLGGYNCNLCPKTFDRLGHFHKHVAEGCAVPVLPKAR